MEILAANRAALFGWGFMIVWVALLSAFTGLFLQEGGFGQFDPALELALLIPFWLFGAGGCYFFFSHPLIRLRRGPGGTYLERIWLWRVERTALDDTRRLNLELEHGRDSEGDPYFRVQLFLPDESRACLFETHDPDFARRERERIETALQQS